MPKVIDKLTVDWPSGQRQSFNNLPANRLYTITEPTAPSDSPPIPPAEKTPPRATRFVRSNVDALLRHLEKTYDDFAREPLLPFRLSQQGPGLACGDVNGDGRDDLFLGGALGGWGSMFVNHGNGKWMAPDELFPPWSDDAAACEAAGTLLFDSDGDGDNDLLDRQRRRRNQAGRPVASRPALSERRFRQFHPHHERRASRSARQRLGRRRR